MPVPSEASSWPKSSWTRQSQLCQFLEEAVEDDRHRRSLRTSPAAGPRNRSARLDRTVHSAFRPRSICRRLRRWQTHPEWEEPPEQKTKDSKLNETNTIDKLSFSIMIDHRGKFKAHFLRCCNNIIHQTFSTKTPVRINSSLISNCPNYIFQRLG